MNPLAKELAEVAEQLKTSKNPEEMAVAAILFSVAGALAEGSIQDLLIRVQKFAQERRDSLERIRREGLLDP